MAVPLQATPSGRTVWETLFLNMPSALREVGVDSPLSHRRIISLKMPGMGLRPSPLNGGGGDNGRAFSLALNSRANAASCSSSS